MMTHECAGFKTKLLCVCVAVVVEEEGSGRGQQGKANQGEGATVAWWTMARQQYLGQSSH